MSTLVIEAHPSSSCTILSTHSQVCLLIYTKEASVVSYLGVCYHCLPMQGSRLATNRLLIGHMVRQQSSSTAADARAPASPEVDSATVALTEQSSIHSHSPPQKQKKLMSKRKCVQPGCNTEPHYNMKGQSRRLYCSPHKKPGMVKLSGRKCLHITCRLEPSFNFKGVVGGLYCRTHKLDSMVNVVKGSCEFESCNKRPIFNNPGATGGRYCSAHAEPGMVDVNSKKCGHVGCSTVPVFNFRGASVGCYCNTHKLQSMVDVANKRCEYDGCHSRAVGYRSGSSQRRLCAMHKRSQG